MGSSIALLATEPAFPKNQTIAFLIIDILDIVSMILILRWRIFGVIGVGVLSVLAIVLQINWGAPVFASVAYGLLTLAITLAFVIPQRALYR